MRRAHTSLHVPRECGAQQPRAAFADKANPQECCASIRRLDLAEFCLDHPWVLLRWRAVQLEAISTVGILVVITPDNREIVEVLPDTHGHLRHRAVVPEADGDARGVGRKTQREEFRFAFVVLQQAMVDGFVEACHRTHVAVGIVLGRLAKNIYDASFQFRRFVGPEHRRWHHRLVSSCGEISAEQVIKRSGVPKRSAFTDRCVCSLSLCRKN